MSLRRKRALWLGVCAAGWLLANGCHATAATAVWIDTDPSIGAPWREVDDAYALALAFRSPELRIVGISSTYGNAGLHRTDEVTRQLVRHFGLEARINEADVYRGARMADDKTARTAATDALAEALRAKKLTYVALGPLTNLAAFLRLHPRLAHRIQRVLFVGGRSPDYHIAFGRNGWLRIHDANVFKDPAAVRDVLNSGIPLVLLPVETSSRLVVEKQSWRELRGGGAAARFLYGKSRAWIWFWTSIVQHRGGPLFDALAVVFGSRPDLVRTEERHASVVERDLLASRKPTPNSRSVQFATRATDEAERSVLERLRRTRSHSLPSSPGRR